MSYLTAILVIVALGSAAVLALGLATAGRDPSRQGGTPVPSSSLPRTNCRRHPEYALPIPPPLAEPVLSFEAGEPRFAFKSRLHLDPRFQKESKG